MVKAKIFLSHASRDRDLAKVLEAQISRDLNFRDGEIFRSSSARAIPRGKWRTALETALLEATVIIPLLTPCGAKNVWVAFEYGYFWGNKLTSKTKKQAAKNFIYPLYSPKVNIPSPLNNDMAKCVTDCDDLETFFATLRDHFHIKGNLKADLKLIVKTAVDTPLVTDEDFKHQMEAKIWLKQARDREEKQVIVDWLSQIDILQGIKLDWIRDLQEVNFPRANLYCANLGGNDLRGASFFHANLEDAHLGTTCLQRADFTGATLTGASFAAAETDEHTKLPDGKPYANVEERWEKLLQAGVKSTDKIAHGIIRCK